MDKMYWQRAGSMLEGWIDTEDGKAWYKFSDIPALYAWARKHRYQLIEI